MTSMDDNQRYDRDAYQRICHRFAKKVLSYANERAAADNTDLDFDQRREHWINVYLDGHLPEIDTDFVLDVTSNAHAFEKSAGRPPDSRAVAAVHALQADIREAIRRATNGEAVEMFEEKK